MLLNLKQAKGAGVDWPPTTLPTTSRGIPMRHLNGRSSILTSSFLLIVILLAATSTPIFAQGRPGRIQSLFGGEQQQVPPDEHGILAMEVDIIPGTLKNGSARLRLQLPDGGTAVFVRDGLERRGWGEVTWRGREESGLDSRAVLTLKGGFAAGKVRIEEDLYEIRPLRGPRHIIQQLDPGSFPGDLEIPGGNPEEMQNSLRALSGDSLSDDPIAALDGPNDLHVLVTYSPQARAAASASGPISQ